VLDDVDHGVGERVGSVRRMQKEERKEGRKGKCRKRKKKAKKEKKKKNLAFLSFFHPQSISSSLYIYQWITIPFHYLYTKASY
jgi:hypothetical protein